MLRTISVLMFFIILALSSCTGQNHTNIEFKKYGVVSGELKKWHEVTITFEGFPTSENAKPNPFRDYRLDVTFTQKNKSYTVPGYYVADGNAAETSAEAGNKWRVNFMPDEEGNWNYVASFRQGNWIAINEDPNAGKGVAFDGAKGSFAIAPSDKTGKDFRGKGLLRYVGKNYLQFAETGEYFLKGGANSPENFLKYYEFDGTPEDKHEYQPRLPDLFI